MKCKEFQIGDWIQDENGSPMRIIKVGRDYACAIFGDNECPWAFEDDDVQPEGIPITPEILEKNGWKRHEIFMDMKVGGNFNFNFSWTDKYGESLFQNGYYMCDCKYVHTIQHALRLCGLDELADNFKV